MRWVGCVVVAAALAATTPAAADCIDGATVGEVYCKAANGGGWYLQGGCCTSGMLDSVPVCTCTGNACPCNVGTSPGEPSASNTPFDNIRLLLKAAEQDQTTLKGKWFSSNSDLDKANAKVRQYRQMLSMLKQDSDQ